MIKKTQVTPSSQIHHWSVSKNNLRQPANTFLLNGHLDFVQKNS